MGEAEAGEAGERQQRAVEFPALHLAEPGVHIAAQQRHVQIRPQPAQLRLAPERGRADAGAARQVRQRAARTEDQRVPHIRTRQVSGKVQAIRQDGGDILGGMHGKVDAPFQQGLLDLLGEQPLAAGLREGAVLDAVAGGADHLQRDALRRAAKGGGERIAHRMGLPEGEGGAACADGKAGRSVCHGSLCHGWL